MSSEEVARRNREKRRVEKERKEQEEGKRKHLANMRVIQRNLVYVIGLPPRLAVDDTLRQTDYFGQYGRITKIVINRRGTPAVGVYITYARKEDAAKAIAAVDGTMCDGRIIKVNYGTTKYCTYYLRGQPCMNPNCMYLHEPGEDADTVTKDELVGYVPFSVFFSLCFPAFPICILFLPISHSSVWSFSPCLPSRPPHRGSLSLFQRFPYLSQT